MFRGVCLLMWLSINACTASSCVCVVNRLIVGACPPSLDAYCTILNTVQVCREAVQPALPTYSTSGTLTVSLSYIAPDMTIVSATDGAVSYNGHIILCFDPKSGTVETPQGWFMCYDYDPTTSTHSLFDNGGNVNKGIRHFTRARPGVYVDGRIIMFHSIMFPWISGQTDYSITAETNNTLPPFCHVGQQAHPITSVVVLFNMNTNFYSYSIIDGLAYFGPMTIVIIDTSVGNRVLTYFDVAAFSAVVARPTGFTAASLRVDIPTCVTGMYIASSPSAIGGTETTCTVPPYSSF